MQESIASELAADKVFLPGRDVQASSSRYPGSCQWILSCENVMPALEMK